MWPHLARTAGFEPATSTFGRSRASVAPRAYGVHGVICRIRTGTPGSTVRCAAVTPRSPSRTGCPGRPRTCNRRVNGAPLHRLSYWTMTGTGPRNRTAVVRLSGGCSAVELDRQDWRGRPDSNQGLSLQRRTFCPLNYAPILALPPRFERGSPALRAGAVTRPAREANALAPRASTRTRVLPLTRRALCLLSYAGRGGGSASIRTKDLRVMSPALSASKLRNLATGTR